MSSRSASARPISCVAPDWWDYTTLDPELVADAAALTPEKMQRLSRPGFKVTFYDTLEDFYLAEALEYVAAWKQSTDDNPVGICGPIGPTEQLPLVARIVNALGLDIRSGHFWGMDEWVIDGKEALVTSANFTGNAQRTNLEAGVLVKDRLMVKRLRTYFVSAIESRLLEKVIT
jgi:hypothetical protein